MLVNPITSNCLLSILKTNSFKNLNILLLSNPNLLNISLLFKTSLIPPNLSIKIKKLYNTENCFKSCIENGNNPRMLAIPRREITRIVMLSVIIYYNRIKLVKKYKIIDYIRIR